MRKLLLAGAILSFGGCATLQADFPGVTPASVFDALDNAVNNACGAVPLVSSLQAILSADGISSPTAAQITLIASQICSVLIPPKPAVGMSRRQFERVTGTPSAPVILGYLNGVPIYGYWTK